MDRRRWALVAVAVALALTVVWVAAAPYVADRRRQHELRTLPLAEVGASRAAAGCRPELHRPASGAGDHVAPGTRVHYPDAPPAFGPHWADYLEGRELRPLYTTADRPPLERLVHSLEHGHTILWYDETVAKSSSELADVEAIAKKFPSNTNPQDKFIAAPWTTQDGKPFPGGKHVALTHWSMGGTNGNPKGQQGVWEYCSKPSGAAVKDFMTKYPYSDAPEPTSP